MSDTPSTPFHYHLELTPPQLKVLHAALHELLASPRGEAGSVAEIISELLDRLPDEAAIRSIRVDEDLGHLDVIPGGGEDDEESPAPAKRKHGRLQAVPDERDEASEPAEEPGDGDPSDPDEDPPSGGSGPSAA